MLFFSSEKILTVYVCFFLAYSRQAVVANLKYFGYKTVTDVLLPLKEMKKKEEFGMELFSKEYVKIKDPNELISKDNLTDSDKQLMCIICQKKMGHFAI